MNSSSGESTAPLDFHISSHSEVESKLIIHTEDCPLCLKKSRNFYCTTCVKNGEFVHSNGISSKKFYDRIMRYLFLKKEITTVGKLCEKLSKHKVERITLAGEVESIQERINIIRLLINEKVKENSNNKIVFSKLKETNAYRDARLHRYHDRVDKLTTLVNEKRCTANSVRNEVILSEGELKKYRQINIKQLVTYIFPISVIEPRGKLKEDSTISALEEACHTAYVHGKWVNPNQSFERQHHIVAPTLPASGDYSSYNDWIAANKDCVPSTSNNTSVDFNPAYNISAALTFTTQLVNMLAYFLDVRLPAKLCYSEFCSNELSKNKFMKKVARLNWNVLHLCLSQNVEPRLLKPECTLGNVLLLLDQTVSDLGRSLTPDINPEESRMLEDALRPLLEVDDPDESGDEGLSYDWEAVPTSNGLPESEPIQTVQSQQISSTSVAGGLITSTAASIASYLGWSR